LEFVVLKLFKDWAELAPEEVILCPFRGVENACIRSTFFENPNPEAKTWPGRQPLEHILYVEGGPSSGQTPLPEDEQADLWQGYLQRCIRAREWEFNLQLFYKTYSTTIWVGTIAHKSEAFDSSLESLLVAYVKALDSFTNSVIGIA
jgi:hypothetical protein